MYIDVHLIMNKTMTVTQLRKSLFDVMTATKVNKQITNIMLHGEVIAEIRPKEVEKFDWEKYEKKMEVAVKYLRKLSWDDVLKVRKSSKARRYKGW